MGRSDVRDRRIFAGKDLHVQCPRSVTLSFCWRGQLAMQMTVLAMTSSCPDHLGHEPWPHANAC
jgi:hypothetical protein